VGCSYLLLAQRRGVVVGQSHDPLREEDAVHEPRDVLVGSLVDCVVRVRGAQLLEACRHGRVCAVEERERHLVHACLHDAPHVLALGERESQHRAQIDLNSSELAVDHHLAVLAAPDLESGGEHRASLQLHAAASASLYQHLDHLGIGWERERAVLAVFEVHSRKLGEIRERLLLAVPVLDDMLHGVGLEAVLLNIRLGPLQSRGLFDRIARHDL